MEALTQKLNNSNYFGNFSSPFALQQEELTQISSSKPIQSNIYSYNNRSPSRIYENNHLIPNVPSNPYLSFPNQNQTYSSSNYDNKIIYNLVSPKNPSHFQNQDQTFQKNEIFNERNLNNDIPPFLKNFQTYPYERKPPLPLPFKDRQNIPERGQSPLLSPFPNNNIRGIPSNNIRESPLNNSFSNNNRIREQSNIYPPFYNQKPLNTAHSYESPYRMKNSFIPDIPISISMPGFQSPDNFQMRPDFKGFNENPLYFSKNHPNENFMNYSGPPGQPLFYNNKLNEQIKENNVFPDFITAFGTYKHYDLTSKGSKFRKIIKQTNSNVDSNFSTDMTYLNVNFLQQSHYDKIFDALKNFVLFDRNVEKLKEELAHKTDFDIRILFQYFDDNNSGQIVITEWRVGFLKLGISAEEKDIYLMVNKYSKDGNKKIGYYFYIHL